MRTRHRVPSIFNLSMVDVLCCALGCVILLWLVNLREAKRQAEETGQAEHQLAATRAELKDHSARLAAAEEERDTTRKDLASARLEATGLRAHLAESTQMAVSNARNLVAIQSQLQSTIRQRDQTAAQADQLTLKIASLQTDQRDVEHRLSVQRLTSEELARKLIAAEQRVSSLQDQVVGKENQVVASARQVRELMDKLEAAESRAKQLQLLANQVPDLEGAVKGYRDKYATEAALARALETEIGQRSKDLADMEKKLDGFRASQQQLEKDKESLARQSDRFKADAENRFAGINLTGRRVVFLVDMSGSMELVDENTVAPSKWQGVRETVARILTSLPELEKFQVIVFSDKIAYPLGTPGQWIDYDAKKSRDQVLNSLALIKPTGGTDMHVALDAAFKLRPLGLDTIYLLSDGLPNLGEGLSAEAARALKETERCEILSHYIRKKLKTTWNRPGPNQARVRINAIGFFYESPDVGAFLWAMARENDGSFVGMSKP